MGAGQIFKHLCATYTIGLDEPEFTLVEMGVPLLEILLGGSPSEKRELYAVSIVQQTLEAHEHQSWEDATKQAR